MKKRFYILIFLTALLYNNLLFAGSPARVTASIGSPANGALNYLNVNWSKVSGANDYKLANSVRWLTLVSVTTKY